MVKKVFSVYDSKSETYSPPMLYTTKGEAIRAFSDQANNKESSLCLHSEDFTLFEVGEWDDQSGEFNSKPKASCGLAIEFKRN